VALFLKVRDPSLKVEIELASRLRDDILVVTAMKSG
jgi:hypothetical protein